MKTDTQAPIAFTNLQNTVANSAVATASGTAQNNSSNGKHPFNVLKAYANSVNIAANDNSKSPPTTVPNKLALSPPPSVAKSAFSAVGPSANFASFNFQQQQNQAVQA